jgi:hypothetical protein
MKYYEGIVVGRGFIHISTEGDIEPSLLASYSDMNLKNISLKKPALSYCVIENFLNATCIHVTY